MRRLVLTPDNEIKEQIGLSRVDLKVKDCQLSLATHEIPTSKEFTLPHDNIEEGIYAIKDNLIYYKCAAKKVRLPRLDATIRPLYAFGLTQDHIQIPYYDIWFPETHWLLCMNTGKVYLYVPNNSAMLPCVFLNLYSEDAFKGGKRYRVCIGGALEGLRNVTSPKNVLRKCKVIINTLLCGKMNIDLAIRDDTYDICGDDTSKIHKLFLNIAYAQDGNIHTPQEANAWWAKHYKSSEFANTMVHKCKVFDTRLKDLFKPEDTSLPKEEGNQQ